ncbi:hypothetical protein HID58_069235 [Brassica napus]|uniref:EIPR1-like beta-propeller domain-containing protein n=1 Tax=Brassica napus TaxID=3708 RepID=A0ABQ7XET0_BRANA|nr:hypothetical protein HID58_069235 [Brassica napus]
MKGQATMQGGSSGIGYGLKYQARCISDVKADTDYTSFLTGTLSLKEENEVHLLRLSSGGSELICEGLFSHPNEIWDLASCPFDQRIFSTVFSTGESFGAAIWQIPELYGQLNSPQLERVASLDAHVLSKDSAGMLHSLSGGAWDPHDVNAVAATGESSVQFWDLRTMKLQQRMNLAYMSGISGRPRLPSKSSLNPVATWAVKCNPEYDGLILVEQESYFAYHLSQPVGSTRQRVNLLLNSYTDYEDSVYGLAWSSREPWVFASLSYDGRVVIESVKPFLPRL